MPPNQDLKEILRLTQDTNHLLHKMHRGRVWGGIIKFVLYALILVAAPLWLYSTYLAPTMEQMLETYGQIQGTGAKVQTQFGDLQGILEQFKSGFSSGE